MVYVKDAHGAEAAAIAGLSCFAGARVLELGSGDGYLTRTYAARAASVLAIDSSAAAVAAAASALSGAFAGNVRFLVGDAVTMTLNPASFDTIFCSNSL